MSFSETVKIGSLKLRNRIIMSAMTRQRAGPTGIPNGLIARYYKQRSGAGLILSEAMKISEAAGGSPGEGSLYNIEQRDGWKRVIEGVKKNNGSMFAQLYHVGRHASPLTTGGFPTIGPSPIAPRGCLRGSHEPYPTPKEMDKDDMKRVKDNFVNSVRLAKAAGFDGIQFHCANGFLLDNFLRSSSNQRKDSYGGNTENRCRFPLEVVDIAIKEWKAQRIAVKVSPVGRNGDMFDQNPLQTFSHFLKELDKRTIGFIEVSRTLGEASHFGHPKPEEQLPDAVVTLREFFSGIVVANHGYDEITGKKAIELEQADMVSFGRLYISNPDLAERLINGWPIAKTVDLRTTFTGGQSGYTDYPFSSLNKQRPKGEE